MLWGSRRLPSRHPSERPYNYRHPEMKCKVTSSCSLPIHRVVEAPVKYELRLIVPVSITLNHYIFLTTGTSGEPRWRVWPAAYRLHASLTGGQDRVLLAEQMSGWRITHRSLADSGLRNTHHVLRFYNNVIMFLLRGDSCWSHSALQLVDRVQRKNKKTLQLK